MKKLQVKYCYSEEETNNFLLTLSVSNLEYPCLHSIQYMAKMHGDGGQEYNADGELRDKISIGSDVIAMIQYFVEVEPNEEESIR